MDKRTLYAGLMVGLLLLAVLGLFVDLWIHFDTYQRDLRTYYYAGRAFAAGLDPYDLGVLSNLASTPLALPFLYPPAVLPLFRLLSSLEFSTAYYLFLGLKIAVLILLLGCWKKDFLPEMGFAFLVFSLLAFNAAIYVDLRVGNISLVEQGLIWLSFSFLLRKRVLLYCLMILLAASFKLMPLLFLALLLLNEDKRRFIYLAGSLLLFLSVQALSFLLAPNLFRAFLNGLGGLDERGVVNPSTMAMLRDLLDLYEGTAGFTVAESVQLGLFLALTLGVLLISWRSYVQHEGPAWQGKTRSGIFLACLVYALVLPRFKAYSYVLLLPPIYSVLRRAYPSASIQTPVDAIARTALVVFFACFSSLYVVTLGSELILGSVLGYSSLMAAYLGWWLYLRQLRSGQTTHLAGRTSAQPEGLA